MLPDYPHTIVAHVFFQKSRENIYYELFEKRPRQAMSPDAFQEKKNICNREGIPVYIIDDRQLELLFNVWKQNPSEINIQKLDFYFDFGAITATYYKEYSDLYLNCR